jgi:recombination protein RecR
MSPLLEHLVDWLSHLPGIGSKSALKLALHLAGMPKEDLHQLLSTITHANQTIHTCPNCFSLTETDPCTTCKSPYSEQGLLCIVENAVDVFSLGKHLPSGSKFHCLGGKLSPLNGVTPNDLHLDSLMHRLSEEGIKEVILATGADVEGEATANYIKEMLQKTSLQVTRIAFGVSVGGNLSVADDRSIQKSLAGRTSF